MKAVLLKNILLDSHHATGVLFTLSWILFLFSFIFFPISCCLNMTSCQYVSSCWTLWFVVCVNHKVVVLTGLSSLSSFSPVSGTFPVLLQLPNGQTMPVAIPASITNSSVHIPTTIPVSVPLVQFCHYCVTVCVCLKLTFSALWDVKLFTTACTNLN